VLFCRVPPFGATAIYINVGLLFACAIGMSFNQGRRFAAIVHAVHLLVIATCVYATDALHYRIAVKVCIGLTVSMEL